MIDFSLVVSVALIHLLAVISPGPDFFMALKNSLTYSRKTGIYTAIGFSLGIAVHITYSFVGVALLISKSPVIYNAIKYIGVAYLLYIGVKSFFVKTSAVRIDKQTHPQDISPQKAIGMGFLTNVLNPKATLFFLSLFTLVVHPDTSGITVLIISVLMIVNTALWFSLVAIFFTQKKIRLLYNQYQSLFLKLFGLLLIIVAIKIAFF